MLHIRGHEHSHFPMRSQKWLRIVDAVLAVGATITLLNNTQRKTLIARPPNRTTARPHDRTTAFHAGHLIPGCVRKYTVRTQILGGIDMFVGRNAAICRKSKSTGDSAGAVSLSRSRHSHCSDPKCTNPTLPPRATCCHTLYRSDEWLSAMYLWKKACRRERKRGKQDFKKNRCYQQCCRKCASNV